MTVAVDIVTAPTATHGVPIGYDDWRYVVEMLLSTGWVDCTTYVAGTEIQRGAASFDQRGNPGVMELTLSSPNHMFSPHHDPGSEFGFPGETDSFAGGYAEFGAGLVMRAGLVKTGDWWPMFTGEVETWVPRSTENDADVWVDVVVVETPARIANSTVTIDAHKVFTDGVTGAPFDLLDRVDWPYGYVVPAGIHISFEHPFASIPEAELTYNALEFARVYANSAAVDQVRADAMGRLVWSYTDSETSTLTLNSPTDIADAITPTNDVFAVVNSVVASTIPFSDPNEVFTASYSDAASIAKYGLRSVELENLVTFRNGPNETLIADFCERIVTERSELVNRLDEVTLDQRHLEHIVGTELDAAATVTWQPRTSPSELTAAGRVRSVRHSIIPTLRPIKWTTTYGLDAAITATDRRTFLTRAAPRYYLTTSDDRYLITGD